MHSTFIMLKPDAIEAHLEESILDIFERHDIKVIRRKAVYVSENLIMKHYADVIANLDIPDFPDRIRNEFVGKTVHVFELGSESEDVIKDVRKIIGTTEPIHADINTIRGRFSIDSFKQAEAEHRTVRNLIHAADSPDNVTREMDLWFNWKEENA